MAKLKKYEELGLDSLLQERRGGRNHAYMTVEEESVNWDLVGLLKEYVLISIVITYVNSLIVTDLTGESFFLIVGGYNTEWMTVFLEEFLQAYPKDSILLVIDNGKRFVNVASKIKRFKLWKMLLINSKMSYKD